MEIIPQNRQAQISNVSSSVSSSTTVLQWFKTTGKIFSRCAAVILFLALWQVLPSVGIIDPVFFPPLSKVLQALYGVAVSGELIADIIASLRRAILGFGLALLVAIPLGALIGWFKKVEFVLDPLLQAFRQTSALALFPVFLLLFGIGETSKVAIVFWGAVWAVLMNTISGVRNVDPLLIKSARSMGSSNLHLFFKVIFPAAFPTIFIGIRLSATTSILILVAAEMMGSNEGLGFLLNDSQAKYLIPKMYAAIITMTIIGLIVNYILVLFEKRINKWKEDVPTVS